jgi:pimeloyl-ACP methyl ester carboxylesterase
MGTAIALSYFDQFGSDRLRSFVFIDMSPYMFSEEKWEYPLFGEFTHEALDGVVEALQTDRSSFVKEQVLEAFFVERPPEEIIDEMYAEMMKTPTDVTIATWQEFCDNDFRDVVGKINIPTLLVYAEQSAIFPGDVGAWMHERIPDSELVVFENSSHCPFWEEPERFNRELATFVAGLKDRTIGAQ